MTESLFFYSFQIVILLLILSHLFIFLCLIYGIFVCKVGYLTNFCSKLFQKPLFCHFLFFLGKTLSLRHSGKTLGKIRSNFQNFGLQSWISDQFLFIIFEILLKINIFQVFLIKPKVFGSNFLGNLTVVMTFH